MSSRTPQRDAILWEIEDRRAERYGTRADQALGDIYAISKEDQRGLIVEEHLDHERAKEYALNVAAACLAALESL